MGKRKRNDYGGRELDAPAAPLARNHRETTLVKAKLEAGVKSLQKALKLAAGFERQKFSRRRKAAEEKGDQETVSRLDAEWRFLKTIDYHAVSEYHLYKTLLKIKAVASSPALSPALSSVKAITSYPAGLNVLARLYKANATHTTLSGIVDDITKSITELDTRESSHGEQNPRERSVSHSENDADNLDASNMASDNVELADRVGSSGYEHSDAESWNGFEDSDEGERVGEPGSQQNSSAVARSVSPSLSLPPEPSHPAHGPSSKERTTDSTFLPALTMGGYWSGSESEAEDDIDIAPRKNRRGQRARQQLWEKKYGSKAKHLQKPQKHDRNEGWDPKRGAQLEERHTRHGPSVSKGDHLPEINPNYTPILNSTGNSGRKLDHRDDGGRLHPSWEAAKKAREMKQNIQFTGKKITFD